MTLIHSALHQKINVNYAQLVCVDCILTLYTLYNFTGLLWGKFYTERKRRFFKIHTMQWRQNAYV